MDQNLDERALAELQQELHTEIYPGTEIMVDVGTHHFVKSGVGSRRVLVPQPSDDPADPLNWTLFWKLSCIYCATLVSFTQGMQPLALAPMFEDYVEDFNSNLTDVVQFTGIAILVLGFSNFIWVPLSESFGRRPVLIFSTLICMGAAIWRARATSYGSFMGACVLNGIGAGPAETQEPAIIADVIFLHDRGKYNTLYFAFYFGSLMTLSAGQIVADDGSNEKVTGPMQDEGLMNDRAMQNSDNQLGTQQTNPTTIQPVKTHEDPSLGNGKPTKQQWKLFQPYQGGLVREFLLPWYLLLFPIIEFAAFTVSWTASSFLTLNLTQTQAFAAPPYNFSNQTIGFFNFAILIGAAIGLFTAGPLSDFVADKLTQRNRGIREPEMRLLAAVPYVIIMIIGNVVTAVGYQNAWSWKVIVIVGYTAAGIQVAALPSIFSTYAVDSYKPVAGSLFVAITVNKNVWGYGFSKFITPWIIEAGYIPPIMTNMALITLWCLCGIIFWFYGKTFRKWTRHSKVHSM